MKKIAFSLGIILLSSIQMIAQTVSIGSADTYTYSLFNMQDPYTRHASCYTSAEIGMTGTITSIGWNIKDVWSNGDGIAKIYLKENTSFLNSDSWANVKSGATVVYDGSVDFPDAASDEWFTLNLATPFEYSSGTLQVLVESNYGGSGNGGAGGDIDFNCSVESNGYSEFWWGDPIQTTGTLSTNRPMLQITFGATTSVISGVENSSEFSIYPNPASDFFNYFLPENKNAELFIFDLCGTQVFHSVINAEFYGSIDVSMLSNGVYYVQIKNEDIRLQRRLVVL